MRMLVLWCAWAGVAEAADLVVESTGEGEKRLLRYEIADGARERMHMIFDMEMDVDAMGTVRKGTAPTLDTWADMKVKVDPDGNYVISFVYTKVKVKGGTGDLAGKEVKEALSGLKGLSGTYTITPAGETLSTDIKLPEGMPGGGNMPFDMREVGARLPDVPVGTGARWTVNADVDTKIGLSFDQTTTYELKALSGNEVTLAISVVQTAPPGPIDTSASGVEGLPAGAIQLAHLDSGGSGESVIRLDHVVPKQAKMGVDMDMAMSMEMMGMSMTIAQKLSTVMSISGK